MCRSPACFFPTWYPTLLSTFFTLSSKVFRFLRFSSQRPFPSLFPLRTEDYPATVFPPWIFFLKSFSFAPRFPPIQFFPFLCFPHARHHLRWHTLIFRLFSFLWPASPRVRGLPPKGGGSHGFGPVSAGSRPPSLTDFFFLFFSIFPDVYFLCKRTWYTSTANFLAD